MSSLARIAIAVVAFTAFPTLAAEGGPHGTPGAAPAPSTAKQEKCEHGVQRSLCARCNPKLAAVYKAKGDWCAEHERPESQCVLCHPELAKKGV
jgi:invasion protein IalB